MTIIQRLSRIGLVVIIVVLMDQVSKYLAIHLLDGKGLISLAGDSLRFLLVENKGGFLSLGASLPDGLRNVIFLFITSIFLAAFFLYTLLDKKSTPLILLSSSMIIGGGVGNLIDRSLRQGGVIDFVNIGIGSLRTGIFNVADMAVMFGCMLLLVALIQAEKKEKSDLE